MCSSQAGPEGTQLRPLSLTADPWRPGFWFVSGFCTDHLQSGLLVLEQKDAPVALVYPLCAEQEP